MHLQIDSVWGWASPPLRLQLVSPHVRSGCRMGEMAVGDHRPPSPARLSHTSDKHPKNTLTELNLLRRHRELCDVVLNVGSRKIFAHRVILSACSPYFRYTYNHEARVVFGLKINCFAERCLQGNWRNLGKQR